jgi:hypothetical protein
MPNYSYTNTFGFLAGNSAGGLANFFNTTQALQPSATAVRGGVLTNAGLPANFISVNPQYANVNFRCACLNASYHSGAIDIQKRFGRGLAFQTNFTWAKSIQLNGTARNPRDWSVDRDPGGQKFAYKASGTYELPVGRNKRFLSSTSGVTGILGKVLGDWQTGAILTVARKPGKGHQDL